MGRSLKKKFLPKRGLPHPLNRFSSIEKRKTTESSWRACTARCRGRSHIESGTPCQDWALSDCCGEGDWVIALADGAGAARFSRYGARFVTEEAARIALKYFDEAFAQGDEMVFAGRFASTLRRLLVEYSERGISLEDADRGRLGCSDKIREESIPCSLYELSSTLLLVAVRRRRYIALHIGDGVIGIERQTSGGVRTIKALSLPENGEFSNETVFVTSSKAERSMRLYKGRVDSALGNITGFILMSDGPEASLYHKRSRTLAPACKKLLSACRDLSCQIAEERLDSTLRNVIAKRTSDDCSLALLAR